MATTLVVGEQVRAALQRESFADVTAEFNEKMIEGLPPAKLEAVWTDITKQFGALQEIESPVIIASDVDENASSVVALNCRFERDVAHLQITVDSNGQIAGFFLRPGRAAPPADEAQIQRFGRQMMLGAVLLLAVPILAGLAWILAGRSLSGSLLAVGAFGWLVALVLRAPVALLAKRYSNQLLLVGASGLLEEPIRLALILALASSVNEAFSLGLGWAAVEVGYALLQGAIVLVIAGSKKVSATVARQAISRQASQPFLLLGAWERVSATMFHIGAALVLFAYPVSVPAVAVMHSALNLMTIKFKARQGVAQTVLFVAGVSILVLGLLATRNLHGGQLLNLNH